MGVNMFDRVINLIGKQNFDLFKSKKVLIVGCGGVGGYALETLVRSGFFNVDIIDFDKIDISNLNRQIITTEENIGNLKIDECIKRSLLINPHININGYNIFLDSDNIENVLSDNYDYIIDACDSVNTKVNIIKYCITNNIKFISCMGTAKKIDPTKLSITTLDKTNYDPLAKVIRKKVKDLKTNKKIYVVSSVEEPIKCDSLASMMMVPASAGILCAKYVIDDVLNLL